MATESSTLQSDESPEIAHSLESFDQKFNYKGRLLEFYQKKKSFLTIVRSIHASMSSSSEFNTPSVMIAKCSPLFEIFLPPIGSSFQCKLTLPPIIPLNEFEEFLKILLRLSSDLQSSQFLDEATDVQLLLSWKSGLIESKMYVGESASTKKLAEQKAAHLAVCYLQSQEYTPVVDYISSLIGKYCFQ